MAVAKVIDEIRFLSPVEQSEVIQFAVELSPTRQLTPLKSGGLAVRLAASTDPAEIIQLKSALARGFYG